MRWPRRDCPICGADADIIEHLIYDHGWMTKGMTSDARDVWDDVCDKLGCQRNGTTIAQHPDFAAVILEVHALKLLGGK
jgi:hypothetical protein